MTPSRRRGGPQWRRMVELGSAVRLGRTYWGSLVIAAVVAGVDLASKYWARSRAGDRYAHGGMHVQVVANRGASWGFGSSAPTLVVGVEVVGVALVLW